MGKDNAAAAAKDAETPDNEEGELVLFVFEGRPVEKAFLGLLGCAALPLTEEQAKSLEQGAEVDVTVRGKLNATRINTKSRSDRSGGRKITTSQRVVNIDELVGIKVRPQLVKD